MTALAAAVPPGAEGLLFSPHLGGRICPASPAMRGAWLGISWGHTQAHFCRAVLESVAYEYAWYLHILHELLPDLPFTEARGVGGGARSAAWNQIMADVLNIPYLRLQGSEFGTWGSALIAGKAASLFDDLAARAAESALTTTRAVPANHEAYAPHVERYMQMEGALNQFYAGKDQVTK